jgi:hypothetical protein
VAPSRLALAGDEQSSPIRNLEKAFHSENAAPAMNTTSASSLESDLDCVPQVYEPLSKKKSLAARIICCMHFTHQIAIESDEHGNDSALPPRQRV